MSIPQGFPSRSRFLQENQTEIQETLYNVTKEGEKNSPDESFERSAALERVYVHEVYENLDDYNTSSTVRSKILQFLNNLDPGSIICDVGCGNGQYLKSFSPSILFSIGAERSFRLAKCAKNSAVEMALCDNLGLPFRDESFDAVLSLSVIHHFATTNRRISAIRELARILKVGGKIVISVWAFEQKSRRFDGNSSQDVLIPWQSPQIRNTVTSDDEEEEDDFLAPYHAYNTNFTEDSIHSNSNSSRSLGDGDSSSISSSSSPNDTCYSFVRRALQKLAGGKRSPWFLDSWTSRDMQKENSLEIRDEDAKDLPIELRKLDDYDYSAVGVKSRSLGSILNPPQKQIVRSLSSVPSLGGENACNYSPKKKQDEDAPKTLYRPKLIKQKQSITDDEEEIMIYHRQINYCDDIKSNFLRKQSSLNEELMAESRIREKERIRKKIQKQVSLNESFLYRSLLTKRLQIIREGFTTKFKKSTGSLERLTKNGFVKIIKNIKTANLTTNSETKNPLTSSDSSNEHMSHKNKNFSDGKIIPKNLKHGECLDKVRRPSESDSSKESSLQSDTSVESEDSFASVIHNPLMMPTSPLALSIQSPTKSQIYPKDALNFSFKPDEPHSLIKTLKGIEKNEIIDMTCELKIKPGDNRKEVKKVETSLSNTSSINRSQIISNVKNLPQIPKFIRKIAHFPIVKRLPSSTGKNIIVPKLVSLEIFNPEIDDSDSSSNDDDDDDDDDEPSSPDSIDSVIDKNIESNIVLTKIEMSTKEFCVRGEDSLERINDTNDTNICENSNIQLTQYAKEETLLSDESPPLSAKIQSHISKNIISNLSTSSQITKHKYQQQQKVNDFILEENEDTEDEESTAQSSDVPYYQSSFKNFEGSQGENSSDTTCLLQESFEDSDSIKRHFLSNLKPNAIRMNSNESCNNSQENSNSTTASLDSPSIGGGSATHHVFHHIFRQNELDELINNHIGNLHIVSSFYEKQSWCVVCEKVQVWTI